MLFRSGLIEELERAVTADATSGTLVFSDGPVSARTEWLGGITIVEVASEAEAKMWAGKVAVACGWPQELRQFK